MSAAFMALPTPADLLGTTGTRETIELINREIGGGGYFGSEADPFRTGYKTFMTQVIEPIRNAAFYVAATAKKLMDPDQIKPIVTMDDLERIPPSMHLPILTYQPVRSLLKAGRIDGFGYTIDQLPEEDVYGRLINNGTTSLHIDDYRDHKEELIEYTLEWEWASDDPDLSFDEMDYIADTRAFLDYVLEHTDVDPTDAPSLRG